MNILAIKNLIEGEAEVILTSAIQILGDIGCFILAANLFFSKKTNSNLKLFYCFIFISFIAMAIDDIYYNYMYRIMHYDIRNSTGILVTMTFVCFQMSQIYSWLLFIFRQKIKVFSQQNLPYLLCSGFVIYVLIYFFYSNQNYPVNTIIVQSLEVTIDMCIWLFAIICFANTTSRAISLLTLGSLLIISADLTTRCLYIFEPQGLAYTVWVHMVWAAGVVIIFFGLLYCLRGDKFNFASEDSLQVTSSSRMVLTSFISFTLGVIFLTLFRLKTNIDMHSILWSLPIVLMFTLIISISLAKKFSILLVEPINQIRQRGNLFDSGQIPPENGIYAKITLGKFINSTIEKLSTQLDRELKIAAQVAHDIRSPLSALQILTEQQLTELEESKRILLRDAVYQIRDIVNNLDQNCLSKSAETQIAILLEHVLSERRAALTEKSICIKQNFVVDSYSLFTKVPPSDIKRVLTNLINNSAEAIQSKNGTIEITLDSDKDNIIITVSDNGCGIPSGFFG
ncbi:MAG: HAMP domain-containing sensor histidine kinase, partial [Gammaproteobacteria bacterium]|nr:HAMP domain-containing sensor histidine kinase [Gammaproteobacteria bacterium]